MIEVLSFLLWRLKSGWTRAQAFNWHSDTKVNNLQVLFRSTAIRDV